jgi:hypothetical protein
MRRYLTPLVASVCLAAPIVVPTAVTAGQERSGCSNATLNGAYAVRATGDVIGIGPFAGVGVFTYDGNGHVSGTLVTRTNGSNGVSTFQGVYEVTSDCFATDTLTATTGAVSVHSYSIFDRGRGFNILNTTVGAPTVIIGEGRQTRANGDGK